MYKSSILKMYCKLFKIYLKVQKLFDIQSTQTFSTKLPLFFGLNKDDFILDRLNFVHDKLNFKRICLHIGVDSVSSLVFIF